MYEGENGRTGERENGRTGERENEKFNHGVSRRDHGVTQSNSVNLELRIKTL